MEAKAVAAFSQELTSFPGMSFVVILFLETNFSFLMMLAVWLLETSSLLFIGPSLVELDVEERITVPFDLLNALVPLLL